MTLPDSVQAGDSGHVRDHNAIKALLDGKLATTVASATYRTKTAASWASITRPYYVAHRGLSGSVPENTFEAFDAAVSAGVHAIELDVFLCADGSLPVMHDATVDRTTTGSGNTADWHAGGIGLLAVDPGTWHGAAWSGTYRVPTLREVLERYGSRIALIVEPKNGLACAQAVVAEVQRLGLTKSVMLNSFVLSELAPAVAAGMRTMFITDSVAASTIVAAGVTDVAVSGGGGNAYGQGLKAAGLGVAAYTKNRKADAYHQFDIVGVDGVISDEPVYIRSDNKHRLTRDPFATKSYYHGHLSAQAATAQRGIFLGTNRWGYGAETATAANFFTLQGWACPLASPTSYTLTLDVTFDALGADTSRWAAVAFGFNNDKLFDNGGTAQTDHTGYNLLFRLHGGVDLFKSVNGTATLIATLFSSTAPTAGQTIRFTVQVRPSGITVTRADTGATGTSTVADALAYRGEFFHLGKNGSGLQASFSNVTIGA